MAYKLCRVRGRRRGWEEGALMLAETEVDLIVSRLCEILRTSMQLVAYHEKFLQRLLKFILASSASEDHKFLETSVRSVTWRWHLNKDAALTSLRTFCKLIQWHKILVAQYYSKYNKNEKFKVFLWIFSNLFPTGKRKVVISAEGRELRDSQNFAPEYIPPTHTIISRWHLWFASRELQGSFIEMLGLRRRRGIPHVAMRTLDGCEGKCHPVFWTRQFSRRVRRCRVANVCTSTMFDAQ